MLSDDDFIEEEIMPEAEYHQCEHEGCISQLGLLCTIDGFDEHPTERNYYCAEHCFEKGFCSGCGGFYAGIEDFDFGNGLCENCEADIGGDYDGGWDDDDVDWDDEYDDEG